MKVKQQKPASTNVKLHREHAWMHGGEASEQEMARHNKRRNTDGSHVFLAGLSHDEDEDDDDEEGETKRVRVQRICLGCGTAEKASETFCS
ncbi:hypothetical protein ACO22_07232 [Paracoccidioides brasiliensis]|uniref:Uncharacterized protein n=1 Tax=Paracoccidioides brasiliensis TaxID=121759 RepID=A0A1D2J588_PARBR|nr:hypothetical protein ACO22_07232 [Paracoccidioides brasiliensis]